MKQVDSANTFIITYIATKIKAPFRELIKKTQASSHKVVLKTTYRDVFYRSCGKNVEIPLTNRYEHGIIDAVKSKQ